MTSRVLDDRQRAGPAERRPAAGRGRRLHTPALAAGWLWLSAAALVGCSGELPSGNDLIIPPGLGSATRTPLQAKVAGDTFPARSGAADDKAGTQPDGAAPHISAPQNPTPTELPTSEPLTFDTAMALLLQRNTTLVQDRSTISRNHLNYQTVAAGYAPDWQARLIGNAQPPLDSTVANQVGAYNDQLGAEIQWTAPWWHKEGVRYDAASAQLDVAGAENTYRADQQNQAVTLYKDYIAVRQYQEKVRVSQSQLDVDRARRNSMAQGAQIGQTAGLSVIIQEANLQNQQATTAQLRDQLFQKWATLFAQLNVSPGKVTLCRNYFDFTPYDPTMTSDQAITEQTRALKIQIAKQQVQLRKAGITWQPELSVRASYGRELQQNVPNSQHDVGNIGVILTIPFPNSSQLTGQQGLAEHDLNDLFQHLDQTTQSTQRTDAEDRTRIPTLASNLRFRQQAMKENQQRLAETRRSFQLGLITYLDLQTVENSIVQSTEDYYDDLATYLDLIADYARLHGQPLPVPHTCVPETGSP